MNIWVASYHFTTKRMHNSSFNVILWPWVNIKVIQSGIQSLSLVISSIIPSLKQISSQVSRHRTMYLVRSHMHSSLPWILLVQNKLCTELQQTSRLCPHTEFHPNELQHLWENGHRSVWFLMQLWPWTKVGFSGLYHHIKSERNRFVNAWIQATKGWGFPSKSHK